MNKSKMIKLEEKQKREILCDCVSVVVVSYDKAFNLYNVASCGLNSNQCLTQK